MLSILAIVETRTKGVTVERFRMRVPPVPSEAFKLFERALATCVPLDPDETIIRLLRPVPE